MQYYHRSIKWHGLEESDKQKMRTVLEYLHNTDEGHFEFSNAQNVHFVQSIQKSALLKNKISHSQRDWINQYYNIAVENKPSPTGIVFHTS